MLLYSTRTAVFKNGDKSVLLCRITLPTGADDEKLSGSVADFYSKIYEATYSFAREYAARILPPDGRLATLTVSCKELLKKERLIVKRRCAVSHAGKTVHERIFTDKFHIKCDKTKNYSLKEQ